MGSLLQSYGIGYPLWALAHVLCFFGAYYGTLVSRAYYIVENAVKINGASYWVVCVQSPLAQMNRNYAAFVPLNLAID